MQNETRGKAKARDVCENEMKNRKYVFLKRIGEYIFFPNRFAASTRAANIVSYFWLEINRVRDFSPLGNESQKSREARNPKNIKRQLRDEKLSYHQIRDVGCFISGFSSGAWN